MDWRYMLPCGDRLPKEVKENLDPWSSSCINLEPVQLTEKLKKEWANLHPSLSCLKDAMLPVGNAALVGKMGQVVVEVRRGPTESDRDLPWIPRPWATPMRFDIDEAVQYLVDKGVYGPIPPGSSVDPDDVALAAYQDFIESLGSDCAVRLSQPAFYLTLPANPDEVRTALKQRDLPLGGSLESFAVHFAGLRNYPPHFSGDFVPAAEWRQLKIRIAEGMDYTPQMRAEWKDAWIIYHANNGNLAILHPDGRMAWEVMQENKIKPWWNSFEEFIRHYVDCRRLGHEFDAYGPTVTAMKEEKRKKFGN